MHRRRASRRLSRPLTLLFASCVAMATLSASCGGTEPEITLPGPSSPTPPLTQDEFTEQANAVCREATKQIAARTDENGPTQNVDANPSAAQAKLVEAIEPVARLAIATLRNITPPVADRALIQRGWDRMASYLEEVKANPAMTIDPIGLNEPELYDYGLSACFSKS